MNKEHSSISPSAKWMSLIKGHTSMPFARQVAGLLSCPDSFVPDFTKRDFTLWGQALHLESRFWSINQLLDEMPVNNILELASGYSFRGLDYAKQQGIHYIDTDLPGVIDTKKEFITALLKDGPAVRGALEVLPLNVLDKNSFDEITHRFPHGEIAVINEGLLTYLNMPEKEKLCSIVHEVLKERGGYWITADIYLKNKQPNLGFKIDAEKMKFFAQQNTEGNSFESFKEAETFFNDMGFAVEKEAKVKYSAMSSFKPVLRSMTVMQFLKVAFMGKLRATWRLKAV